MSPATQGLVGEGTACLRTAAAAADAAALFSPNEDRDDLATADVKYLLLPFYQAEVAGYTHAGGWVRVQPTRSGAWVASSVGQPPSRAPGMAQPPANFASSLPCPAPPPHPAEDASVRLDALNQAGQLYRVFLHRCRQYDLLSQPAAAMAQAVLGVGERDGDGGARGSGSGSGSGRLDPASLRQHKIEKFKRCVAAWGGVGWGALFIAGASSAAVGVLCSKQRRQVGTLPASHVSSYIRLCWLQGKGHQGPRCRAGGAAEAAGRGRRRRRRGGRRGGGGAGAVDAASGPGSAAGTRWPGVGAVQSPPTVG